jgi:hypothetical protein
MRLSRGSWMFCYRGDVTFRHIRDLVSGTSNKLRLEMRIHTMIRYISQFAGLLYVDFLDNEYIEVYPWRRKDYCPSSWFSYKLTAILRTMLSRMTTPKPKRGNEDDKTGRMCGGNRERREEIFLVKVG